MKYAPQHGLDKDRAAALVIARRGLGFRERVPRTYRKLLENREFLKYALFMWSWRRQELREELEAEGNRWVRKRLRRFIRQATLAIRGLEGRLKALMQSPGSDPAFPAGTARGKKSRSGRTQVRNKGWRVLRAAVVVPLLASLSEGLHPPETGFGFRGMREAGEVVGPYTWCRGYGWSENTAGWGFGLP